MKYTWQFKYQCVMHYKEGGGILYPINDCSCKKSTFHNLVLYWVRLYDIHGIEGLKHNSENKYWTEEEKFKLVSKVLAGNTLSSVAIDVGINSGTLCRWVQLYKKFGYDGLKIKKRGRPSNSKETIMTEDKNNKSHVQNINESEKEELIRLRERVEYLETELAYRKKLSALIAQKKREKQAKAKKHK